jgi:protein-S-isoprenylcysteine O-methyltransferase Ste14
MGSLASRFFLVIRGVLYSAAFIGLWTWLAFEVRAFDAGLPFALPGWLGPIGIVLASAGALLAGWSIATFLTTGRGTPAPFDPPRVFVASGPYRYVRNPMYVGATLAMFGAGLTIASPSVLALALGFVLLMHLFVVLHEEPALERTFGASYVAYKAQVDRWIPSRPQIAD